MMNLDQQINLLLDLQRNHSSIAYQSEFTMGITRNHHPSELLPDDFIPGLDRLQTVLDAVLGVGGAEVAHVDERPLILLVRYRTWASMG